MRILFLTPRFLLPPDRGDKIRPLYFAKSIKGNKRKLYLISLVDKQIDADLINECKEVFTEIFLFKREKFLTPRLLLYPYPVQLDFFKSNKLFSKIKEILEEISPHIVYIYHLRMAQYILQIKRCNFYTIMDFADCITMFLSRMKMHSKNFYKVFLNLEIPRVRSYEKYLADKFDESWFTSSIDLNFMQRFAKVKNPQIIPNGVDTQYFFVSQKDYNEKNIIFVGYMSIESVHAVLYFYNRIFPLIKSEIPDVKFYIVGANPPPCIRNLASKDVIVTGFVPDLRPYYLKARVMVAPLHFVVGIQNKILEAMAMKVPVVCTPEANEGIFANDSKEVFVEKDDEKFAKRVIELLKDEELCKKIGENARKFVEKNFSWNKVLDRIQQIERKIKCYNISA